MAVLVCLAEHAPEPVPKEKLFQEVWPDTFVGEGVLTLSIHKLRQLFQDEAKEARVIETIAKRGYRLVAPVTRASGDVQSPYLARFECFEINLRSGEIRKNGERIRLPEQCFQILAMLLECPGDVVMRPEIQKKFWPNDTVVEFENTINVAVKRLRVALGDSADQPRYIETLARRGYRWRGPVEWIEPHPAQPQPRGSALVRATASSGTVFAPEAGSAQVAWRWKITVLVLLVALIVAGGLYRSHQRKRLTEKDTIVLSDFANSTGDPVFDDTLKTALNVSLRQSPFLNVLSDSEVAKTLQLMTRPTSTKLTPEVARDVCLRAGSKAYLAGAVGSLGSKYVLELKAVNCRTGDTLAEHQVTAASKEKVLNTLGDAASKLRGELGESLATVQKFDVPLAEITTPSLNALKAFSLGTKDPI